MWCYSHDMEMGAGTFHARHFLAVCGSRALACRLCTAIAVPRMVAMATTQTVYNIIISSKVVLKPNPPDIQELYLGSLKRRLAWYPNAWCLVETTGNHQRLAHGDLVGKFGSMAWKLPSLLTSSKSVVLSVFLWQEKSRTVLSALPCISKAWTVCMIWYGRMANLVVSPMVMRFTKRSRAINLQLWTCRCGKNVWVVWFLWKPNR